jgi:choline dehydrogenase-like flavoprotein
MTAAAMTPFQVSELAPGADRTTDDEILDWVKKAAETTYHPVGTCKMGSDPMAVVDAQLRVHGIAGLRVADASIMPTLISGNTNAPSIMIGENGGRHGAEHRRLTRWATRKHCENYLGWRQQRSDFDKLAGVAWMPSVRYFDMTSV